VRTAFATKRACARAVAGAVLLGLIAAAPAIALADPCEAPLPKRGTTFSGIVRYVGDGDMVCVSDSVDPRTWIEVRLADFYAPELHEPGGKVAQQTLSRLAMDKRATCTAGKRSYDRVVATCTVEGRSIGDMLRRAGIREGGNGR
jgi:endonuclease YncB( thermonuclease family)